MTSSFHDNFMNAKRRDYTSSVQLFSDDPTKQGVLYVQGHSCFLIVYKPFYEMRRIYQKIIRDAVGHLIVGIVDRDDVKNYIECVLFPETIVCFIKKKFTKIRKWETAREIYLYTVYHCPELEDEEPKVILADLEKCDICNGQFVDLKVHIKEQHTCSKCKKVVEFGDFKLHDHRYHGADYFEDIPDFEDDSNSSG